MSIASRLFTVVRIVAAAVLIGPSVFFSAPAEAQSYTFQNVQIVGGGFVDGMVAQPGQNGLFYARTDVGGAYRYNSTTGKWVPLLDWITPAEWWYIGADSIAIDPNNTQRLYISVGEYSENYDGDGAILVSTDQGNSFTTVAMPFRMGSNDNGRNGGERLQVDPNYSPDLLYGSYNDGLWMSNDHGSSWTKNSNFPVQGGTTGAGIIFVAYDAASGTNGAATQNIYVGVSDNGTGTVKYSSLYVTHDGGTTWSAVAGQPTGLYLTHGLFCQGAERELYITYSNAIGPTGMTSGQVWRFHATDSYWTNISPPNPNNYTYGFGGLAVDYNKPGRVLVSTMDRYYPGDTLFLTDSADGGTTTWNDVGAIASYNSSISPWVDFGNASPGVGNWLAALVLDPNNTDHAMYGTGGTVWNSTNFNNADSNAATNWSIGAAGIEETVVSALVSPTAGPDLYSGVWDLGGFVHTSLTASPAGGMNENPRLNKVTGIDYAKNSTGNVVTVGYGGTYGGYSTNSGSSWTPFGSGAGSTAGGGTVAVTGDASVMVYAPTDVPPSYSTDKGSSWTSLSGVLPTGVQMVSDGSSGGRMYAWDAGTGVFYASTTYGKTWYAAATGLATGGLAATPFGIIGDIWIANGSGLFHCTNAGGTWNQVDAGTVTSATAVGFGKVIGTATYPTMYMIGTVGGVTGIFRSTNEGVNWTQINGTATQWGLTYFITGDPKTAGTVYIGTSGRGIIYGTSPN